jgi:lipid-A-disaccharide synthase-like uncharacterized protein
MADAVHRAVLYVVTEPIFLFGFFANFLFMMRFVVQWVHSERHKKSLVPLAFWFFSVGGGVAMLTYGILRRDPVIIAGQGLGLIIYARNLWMIFGRKAPAPGADALDDAKRLVDDLATGIHSLHDWRDRPRTVDDAIDALQKLKAATRKGPS